MAITAPADRAPLKVVLADQPISGLSGYDLDTPSGDDGPRGHELAVAGWVVGADGPIDRVEIYGGGQRLACVPLRERRADLLAGFPDSPHAEWAGFRTFVSLVGLGTPFRLVLSAVSASGETLHFASISGSRSGLDPAPDSLTPVLMSNLGRSGSTWLTHLLGQHPEVIAYRPFEQEPRFAAYWMSVFRSLADPRSYYGAVAPGDHDETWWLGLQRKTNLPVFDFDPWLQDWLASDHVTAALAFCRDRIDSVYRRISEDVGKSAPRCFVERIYGSGGLTAATLREAYPEAVDIFLTRDFRDMFASMRAFSAKEGLLLFDREARQSDSDYLGDVLAPAVKGLGREWVGRRDSAIHVRYEDLVTRETDAARRVFRHLGVASDRNTVQEVLERAHSAGQDRQQGHMTTSGASASIGRWRSDLEPDLVALLESHLEEELALFGYDT